MLGTLPEALSYLLLMSVPGKEQLAVQTKPKPTRSRAYRQQPSFPVGYSWCLWVPWSCSSSSRWPPLPGWHLPDVLCCTLTAKECCILAQIIYFWLAQLCLYNSWAVKMPANELLCQHKQILLGVISIWTRPNLASRAVYEVNMPLQH